MGTTDGFGQADEDELTPTAEALLWAVAEICGDPEEERGADTETAARNAAARLRAQNVTFMIAMSRPWFGIEREARELERRGLVEIDVGMAQFHPPGAATPTPDCYFLVPTAAGRVRADAFHVG